MADHAVTVSSRAVFEPHPTTTSNARRADTAVRSGGMESPNDRAEVRGAWTVRRSFGSAVDFHHRALPHLHDDLGEVWIHRVERPALVLGSTQPLDLLDQGSAESRGWEVGRRRSGGGLVVISPGTHIWIDIVIGRLHPLWDDDINQAFDWVGALWATVLAEHTGTMPSVHRGPLLDRHAGRLLCFAGLGAGEVELDGHKIIGLSQRRTRAGARFQTMLELADHTALARPFARGELRDLIDERLSEAPSSGSPSAGVRPIGLPPGHPARPALSPLDRVVETFVSHLPQTPVSPT